MISSEQYEKAKQFIYRNGRLIDRKRFAFHFEDGNKKDVLDSLSCYQNKDGGFGNGLELDVMCPESSPICTEVALGIMIDCDLHEADILKRCEQWVMTNQTENGTLRHPIENIRKYPHGDWWLNSDDNRVFAIAGYLTQMNVGKPEFYENVTQLFKEKITPFPNEFKVYDYPLAIYFENSPDADQFIELRSGFNERFTGMLEEFKWHCPLFFCSDRWYSPRIEQDIWKEQAEKAIKTLQEDGGVLINNYADLPWWRPVWTLEMLIRLKKQGLLNSII